jgi:eukaryotic-like serine/threonine-protein kinase
VSKGPELGRVPDFVRARLEGVGLLGDQDEPEDYEDYEERRGWSRGRWILVALLVAAVAGLVAFALTRPDRVSVPNVIGQEEGTARQLLEDKGFDADTVSRPSAAPRDTVTEQDPIPGEKVDEGSTVVLTISSGPASVAVPDVQGLSEAEATKRLEDAGLLVDPEFAFSDTIPEGRAIGTDPGPGISLDTGQTVKLIVSRGSNKVEVPSVIGLQDDQALARLQSADLAGTVVERDSDEPAGKVLAQSPTAGKLVRSGSSVTIFVSTGAISVPSVIGQDRASAVTALKRAGFVVSIDEQPTTDPTQSNRVLNQFPPGGSRGQRGDTVTISVGVLEPTTTPG